MKLYDLRDVAFRRNTRFTLQIAEFRLDHGEKVALVGPNGAGKTTLLRILSFLEKPDSWTRFLYRGQPYPARAERSGLGFLQQQPYLFHGTVAENLAYPLNLRRLPSLDVSRRVDAMLATMELGQVADARARALSGGEQKRLALGRVLIADPELLLLDEPIAHLDVRSRAVIEDVLKKAGKTILLTTHDLYLAHRLADRVLTLRAGRLSSRLPENILEGRRTGSVLETARGLRIELPPDSDAPNRNGLSVIMIDPGSLVLSLDPLASSMPNHFSGRVTSVREQGTDVWLEVDCGERLTAILSRDSYEEMGINLHRKVVVSFGANAVENL